MPDVNTIIQTVGLAGIFAIIFVESGLLVGFFLPGDTLLFSAGVFASQGYFPLYLLILIVALGAVLGDSVGYISGHRFGKKLFEKEDGLFFNKNKILQAEIFYKKYGPVSIVLSRFIPVVRTFVPVIAGVASMEYKKFLIYNIIGGLLWATIVPILGYYLGSKISNPDKYLLPIMLAVVVVSFMPIIFRLIHKLYKKV